MIKHIQIVIGKKIMQCCPMCFRRYNSKNEHWIQHSLVSVQKFIDTEWERPIYQDVIQNILLQANLKNKSTLLEEECENENISLCVDCTVFIKKKANKELTSNNINVYVTRNNHKIKHSTSYLIDFILSGGCTIKPCSSFMIHAINSFLYEYPSNPIYSMTCNNLLLLYMGSINHYANSFFFSVHDCDEFLCMIKWIWCGAPFIFHENKTAKCMRKYVTKYPGHYSWWRSHLPSACRFCGPVPFVHNTSGSNISESLDRLIPTFDTVLTSGKINSVDIEKWTISELEKIEEESRPIDHISVFCEKCCKISVISFTYHTIAMHLFDINTGHDGYPVNVYRYYHQRIQMYKNIKRELVSEV